MLVVVLGANDVASAVALEIFAIPEFVVVMIEREGHLQQDEDSPSWMRCGMGALDCQAMNAAFLTRSNWGSRL